MTEQTKAMEIMKLKVTTGMGEITYKMHKKTAV